MSRKFSLLLQFLVLLAAGLLLLWLAFQGQDLGQIMAELAHARWEWIGLSLGITLLGHLGRARRWQLLIAGAGFRARFLACFVTLMTGYLSNLGIPRVGEVSRCASLNRLTSAPILALGGTVVAERAADLLTLALLFMGTLALAGHQATLFFSQYLLPALRALLGWKLLAVALMGCGALGLLALLAVGRRKVGEKGLMARSRTWAREIGVGLMSLGRMKPLAVVEFGVHTAGIWLSYYAAPFCTLMALGVTEDVVRVAFYVFVLGSLSRTLPLPAGSAGAYHFIVSEWMVFLGHARTVGLSVATLNHAVQTLFYLALGTLSMVGFFLLLRLRSRPQSQPR